MHWAAFGALSACVAVAAGAFGAHELRGRLAPDLLAVFETAVRYHLVHALALLGVGLASGRIGARSERLAGGLFSAGTVLFAGSLYALALTGVRVLGAITPLGGVCWIAGWLVFARALFRATPAGPHPPIPPTPPLVLGALLALGLAAAPAHPARAATGSPRDVFAPATGLRLEKVATGLDRPVHLTAPAGDPRLFVVEQGGRIRVLRDGRLLPRPFLDLSAKLRAGGEQGLLSLAFHPRYRANGTFFVNYTDRGGDTRVERYRVSAREPDVADPSSGALVLAVDQPYSNHNGGHVLFGPDGMLYVAMGDGGAGGDPGNRAQNPKELLGKLLRLDVDAAAPYAIPRGNPFAGRPAAGRPEIWALGLRNPWRCAFDAVDSLLYIADVGQGDWEEVDVQPAARAGVNYGWNVREGRHAFGDEGRSAAGMTGPVVEYPHQDGCSITGGAVYRGRQIPQLVGHYVFSDYCSGWIRSFRMQGGRAVDLREWTGLRAGPVTSFGVDGAGEMYVLDHRGTIYRLAQAAPPRSPAPAVRGG